jgi:hypothetical protein
MPECFVIMPMTTPVDAVERYGGDPDHFAHFLDHLFLPAIKRAGFQPKKPAAEGADLVHAEIVRNLEMADLVLCDCSALNANVFFELGIRTALGRAVCMVKDDRTRLPSDLSTINCHSYASMLQYYDLEEEIARLARHIKVVARDGPDHNALWAYFGLTQRGSPSEDVQGAALQAVLTEVRELVGNVIPADQHDPPVVAAYRTLMDDVLTVLGTDVRVINVTRRRYSVIMLVDVLPEPSVRALVDARAARWGFELELVEDKP